MPLWPPAAAFVIGKTVAMVALLAVLDITLWKSLLIAAVSASIGAFGSVTAAIIAARIASREAKRNRRILQDVQSKVGADQRQGDRNDLT